MNGDVVIRVDGLGKRYQIGQTLDLARTFRETLVSLPRFLGHKVKEVASTLRDSGNDSDTPRGTFWALKDVGFEVKQGEVVGIIGRNGAGKSTLLKILSRITAPTAGRAEIYGRVGSLLEVGTGFHPELTGRENIYLNGAILGMKRAEIARKFDEIVEFAEVTKFLDTPVKRYSSGMQVRLAFAVAAHLDPEILIIDEVLAVGDAEFQKKCLGKMSHVAKGGRTVLFVSHNMQAVKRLCGRAILLGEGKVQAEGNVDEVVDLYLSLNSKSHIGDILSKDMHRYQEPGLEILRVVFLNYKEEEVSTIMLDEPFTLAIYYRINKGDVGYRLNVLFRTGDSTLLTQIHSGDALGHLRGDKDEVYCLKVKMKNAFLPGNYLLDIYIKSSLNQWTDIIEGLTFAVAPVSYTKGASARPGFFRIDADWELPSRLEGSGIF
jgi:lipopolysaccharide transport system ATP-binding protein